MDSMDYQDIDEGTPVKQNYKEQEFAQVNESLERGQEKQIQSKPSTNDSCTEPIGDGMIAPFEPSATSSKSRSIDVKKGRKGNLQDFVRSLRPNLPRNSKSRANDLLKRFAKGFIVVNPMQVRIPLKKRRPRRARMGRLSPQKSRHSTRSLTVRRSAISTTSTESCISDSCPKCGHECCYRFYN